MLLLLVKKFLTSLEDSSKKRLSTGSFAGFNGCHAILPKSLTVLNERGCLMNSRRNTFALLIRILFALLVIAGALALLGRARSGPVAAQGTQTVPATKRLLENRVPEHLPIRVKIKREKEKLFRDLDNDNWARDLEVEVKNVGDKPIYSLYFQLHVPEAKIANGYQSFGIAYGRAALSKWEERPTPEDVPIKPGETIILKIEDTQLRGWDGARDAGLVPGRIHGVRLWFQDLSFGDGTGFDGATAAPWPRPGNDKQSSYLRLRNSYGRGFKAAAATD